MVPTVTLSSGVEMPRLQLGTFRTRGQDVLSSLEAALACGYRAIDTADVYRNHTEIASSLEKVMPGLGLARSDLFITSKLSPRDHGAAECERAVSRILGELGTDYLDLFLIHWPGRKKLDVGDPRNKTLRAESWKVMERYHKG